MSRVKSAAGAAQMTSRQIQTSWSHWSLCLYLTLWTVFLSAQNSTIKLSSPFIVGELNESRWLLAVSLMSRDLRKTDS